MDLLHLYTLTTALTLTLTTDVTGECGNNQWQCLDGSCVLRSWRCDGTGDCLDGSDEMECACSPEDFECADSSLCIPKSAVCDDQPQCSDGSDELNCYQSPGCLLGDWSCRNKICIPQDLRCNGLDDCGDGSDEEGCGYCGELNVRCSNGTCLTLRERCDGVAQCSDGRDEPVTCGRMCHDKNGGCSHMCTDQLWGALCSCPSGQKLSTNGAKCEDIDECIQAYGPCMHTCINTKGSFQCRCESGFKLQSGNVCQAQGNVTKLLTTKKGVIGLVSVKARTYKTLFTAQSDPVTLTFDIWRNLFYWADGNGNIYKTENHRTKVIFSGHSGIKSLALDWINGQIYWTNLERKRIYAGSSNGSAMGVVVSKNTEPTELVLLPGKSTMFWINKGPDEEVTIERAGMDGSMQATLVVVTAQSPKSLTMDVAAKRLYWISDFKMSIETVKVDGVGRYTFLEFFMGRTAQSLAVFNGFFYWADEKRLWKASQTQPSQKTFILKGTMPLLVVYHELQQPRGTSPCKKSACPLCLPSPASSGSFTCLCSDEKLPLPYGSCENFKLAYATSTNVYTLECTAEGPLKSLLFSTDEDIQSIDMDWKREWVIWTNGSGHVKARPFMQNHSDYIPTLKPACIVKVDQKTGNLYWLSCDLQCIGVTHVNLPDQNFSNQLYHTSGEIDDLFVDWERGQLYWLENDQLIQMRLSLMGGNAKAIYSFEPKGVRQIALDRKANSFLWNSQNELQVLGLLILRKYSAGKERAVSGVIVAAYEPYVVAKQDDVITLWRRQNWTRVRRVALETGVVGVTVAMREVKRDKEPIKLSPTQVPCERPSFLCKSTPRCIPQDLRCDGKKDCPDGSDEASCLNVCVKIGDFLCKDRKKCVERYLVCDGRPDCIDGSDELNCNITTEISMKTPFKCRLGFKPCKGGSECVWLSHICDGEVDCKDGSDEEGCEHECRADQFHCAHGRMCIDKKLVCDGTPQCQDRSDELGCFTDSHSCSHHCDNKTRCVPQDFLCDGERDCVDGTDEAGCSPFTVPASAKPSPEPSCSSPSITCGGTCVNQTQLCDGNLDCSDGFDELFCLHACLDPGQFMCKNRRKCIKEGLVCDGQPDCLDGSDELQCPACPLHCDDWTVCLTNKQFCDGKSDCRDGSDEKQCYMWGVIAAASSPVKCPLGSKRCADGKECILNSHVCDGEKDCKDGSDEQHCQRKCKPDEFQCAHGMMCIDKRLVCDGTPQCQDRSDELRCFTHSQSCSHHCDNKTHCIPQDFLCDGERDCRDGTDEADCLPDNGASNKTSFKLVATSLSARTFACRSPSVLCEGTLLCIFNTQFCDGKKDCPDGSDESSCVTSCTNMGDFLCTDKKKCVEGYQVCDGQPDCTDGSDEMSCPTVAATTAPVIPFKCRLGFEACKDGADCVLISHMCDGENDCKDGSDEEGCDLQCNPGQFQCIRGRRCIERKQVCDGTTQCEDGSDEAKCWKPTRSCSLRCDNNSRCIPEVFICNGMRDCWDGSDETDCANPLPHPRCKSPSIPCLASSQCISQRQLCNGRKDCADGSDERPCIPSCPYDGDFLCRDRRRCLDRTLVCDGRFHCTDGSDEVNCPTAETTTVVPVPFKCRLGLKPCKDGSDCILYGHVCDGEIDCKDGSDEEGCDVTCQSGQFQCAHGKKCIDAKLVCDGKPQCQDRSDELDCITRTKSCSHRCDNKTRCIPEGFLCDGERDCVDGTDEANCGYPTQVLTCPSPSVWCRGEKVCISATQMCDGKRDCPDGFDEESCIRKCYRGGVLCKDKKKCVEGYLVCDGRPDCTDGSDERGCPTVAPKTTNAPPLKCRLGFKPCKDGSECVLLSHVCDGENDCKDGSDEEGCEHECRADQFHCAHGRMCIDKKLVCDGTPQCQDRSDELGCFTRSHSCSHHCDNKTRCIPQDFLCDGERDCADGTDEAGCPPPTVPASAKPSPEPSCTSPSITCGGTSLCVNQTQLCDGNLDCPDGFDELFCLHGCLDPGNFLCKNRRKCIDQALVCNGRPDCLDGSDELQCRACSLRCDDGTMCLANKQFCDGKADCRDGSDERNCYNRGNNAQAVPVKCPLGSRPCRNGKECVLNNHVCDGEKDCKDGSDEKDCERQCKKGRFQCAHGRMCIDMKLVCDGTPQCQDRSDELNCFQLSEGCNHHCDNRSRCIPNTFLCDGERDCMDGTDEQNCAKEPCSSGQFQCASGQCVSARVCCDGHADCYDRSDEKECRKPPRCFKMERCPNSHECLLKEWLCDGYTDCSDGSDEQDCKTSPVQCEEFQWSCATKNQCIPSSWRCDRTKDCKDQSDEFHCDHSKCPIHQFQCENKECVNLTLVCNGVTHCLDGSDEGPGCLENSCSGLRKPACEHYCFNTPHGAKCGCQPGYEILADGVSCADIDECNGVTSIPCSHTCVNTHGSYVCQCHLGYRLEPDGRSCKTQEEPRLLASVQYELLLKGLRTGNLQVLLPPGQKPIFSLDYDWAEQRLYWISLQEESIKYAVHGDKDSIRTLVKGVKSDCIAVDWLGRNLYWVDGVARQILAVRMSSSVVRTQNSIVILDEDLEQPRSLVLLPQKGLMLWSEIGSEPRIEQAGMDGLDRKVILRRSLSWPVAMTVDVLTDRIYWADEKLKCIGSATMNGQDIRLLQLMETASPFSVAVFNNMIYWSDTQNRAIHEAHKVTGKNHKVVLKRLGQPFALKVVHPLVQPKVPNPCKKLGCSHICLLAPESKTVCRCPPRLLLAEDGLTCSPPQDSSSFLLLLSPTTLTKIFTRSLRGDVGLKHWPDHQALALPGINQATDLDLVLRDNKLFLADGSHASVAQIKLVNSALTTEGPPLQLPGDTVTAMAVDWITHNLYWSSVKQPHLFVTSAGWKYTAMVLQSLPQETISIALHPPSGRLCFTAVGLGGSEKLPQVDCASMDGRNHVVLWKKAQMPMYLTFSSQGSMLYWVDIATEVIGSVKTDGSNYKEYKTGPPLIVSFALSENILFWVTFYNGTTRVWYSDGFQPKQMWFEVQTNIVALKAYSTNSQKGTNQCLENNGDCSHLCLAYPSGRTCRCTQGYIAVNKTQCVPNQHCPAGTKPCRDGYSCLASTKFCDRISDCHDGSDEEDCTYRKTNPGASSSSLDLTDVGTTQDEVLLRTLGGHPCNSDLCNRRGQCVMRKGEPVCECEQGYSGQFCQDGGSSSTPGVLAVLFIFGLVVAAAVVLKRKRDKAARGCSTDKETLMKDLEGPEAHPQNFVNELYNPDEEEVQESTSVN